MGHGGCGYVSDGGCVWVMAGCVSVWVNGGDMAIVCGSWRLCVGHGGCVWVVVVVGGVMAVVCGSWRLCVGCGGCV